MFFEVVKNKRNVTNFVYVFITKFHITHNNVSSDSTVARLEPQFFLKSGIFKTVKKITKNSYGF